MSGAVPLLPLYALTLTLVFCPQKERPPSTNHGIFRMVSAPTVAGKSTSVDQDNQIQLRSPEKTPLSFICIISTFTCVVLD
jgi:hypothetical protein